MSRISISSVLLVACVCGAVASAGVVGTYAVMAPLVAGANSAFTQAPAGPLPVWVKKNANGVLVPSTDAVISFLRYGNIVQEAAVGYGGAATVEGLETGGYSIFISGADGFAAFGSWLIPGATVPDSPGSKIDVALVPEPDLPVVWQILDQYVRNAPPGASWGPGYDSGSAEPLGPDYTRRELMQGQGFELDPTGAVHGRIILSGPPTEPDVPLAGLNVFFIQGGRIVGQSRTGQDGVFHASDLYAGVHSFVVAGPGAFLTLSVAVHPPAPGAGAETPITEFSFGGPQGTQEVALQDQEVAVFDNPVTIAHISPIFPGDLPILFGPGPLGQDGQPFGAPFGGGGFGGGGSGGGGGGGGFGGLGPLLGLAALGAAAAALAEDDDNPIISPAIP